MADASIKIEGLDKLLKKVRSLEGLEVVKGGISAAAVHVKGKIAKYPPGSEANQPKAYPGRWYVRGRGQFWARADGSVGSKYTSEDLGQKWTVQTRNGGLTAIVGNNVSYGPFVQDEDRQTHFHKARGWKTTQTVAEEETREVTELVIKAVEDALRKI